VLAASKRGQLAKWIGDAVPSVLGYVAAFAGLIAMPETLNS
jgi:hypothetical protein